METHAPKIKFCGLTDPADAAVAIEAGAWAIGLILWPDSPRACDPALAAEIAAEFKRKAEIVGVFVNPTLDEVATAADTIGLSMIQLHGDEGPVFCGEVARRTGCKVIKAARVRDRSDIQALNAFHTDFHLLDSHVAGRFGGTGATFEWELVRDGGPRRRGGRVPVILSGGLTAENVVQAISVARPFAVDVASGVESSPGHKDHFLVREFASAARAGFEAVARDESEEVIAG